ncbi:MAG TPA: hypothetical protein VIP70_09290 [Nitrososphaeraceae archaeon]
MSSSINNNISLFLPGEEDKLSEKEQCMIASGCTEKEYWDSVESGCQTKPKDKESYDRPAREKYCKITSTTTSVDTGSTRTANTTTSTTTVNLTLYLVGWLFFGDEGRGVAFFDLFYVGKNNDLFLVKINEYLEPPTYRKIKLNTSLEEQYLPKWWQRAPPCRGRNDGMYGSGDSASCQFVD